MVAAALAVAAAGAYLFVRSTGAGGDGRRAPTPTAFAGYTRVDGAVADRVKSAMRQMVSSLGGAPGRAVMSSASIGLYSHDTGDQPVLITVTMPTPPSAAGSDDVVTKMIENATPSSEDFPSGRQGGAVRCGLAQYGVTSETMCAWSDAKESGVLVSVRESLSPADLAALTGKFRDAVE
jgi:hypothetical protein